MAPGRRDGAGWREGDKGASKRCHEAATSWGEDPPPTPINPIAAPAFLASLAWPNSPGKRRLLTL